MNRLSFLRLDGLYLKATVFAKKGASLMFDRVLKLI